MVSSSGKGTIPATFDQSGCIPQRKHDPTTTVVQVPSAMTDLEVLFAFIHPTETLMRTTALIPLALILAASVAGAQGTAKKAESQADLQKEAKMTMVDARAMALREVPNSKVQAGEIEREGGKLIYSFDMKVANKSGIDEVNIDAMTGKLVSKQHETPKDEKAEAKADKKAAKAAKAAAKAKP